MRQNTTKAVRTMVGGERRHRQRLSFRGRAAGENPEPIADAGKKTFKRARWVPGSPAARRNDNRCFHESAPSVLICTPRAISRCDSTGSVANIRSTIMRT